VNRAVDAEQIDLDDALELDRIHDPRRRRGRGDPGVRNDDIDAAEALDRSRDCGFDRLDVGDVRGQADRAGW
jgi:hypothetical protein